MYVDDILVWGADKAQDDERLRAALERAEKTGLTFNAEKCVFGVSKITFLGDVINADGVLPSPDLIKSIQAMPASEDKNAVWRMMGVVNYFCKVQYLPRQATTRFCCGASSRTKSCSSGLQLTRASGKPYARH